MKGFIIKLEIKGEFHNSIEKGGEMMKRMMDIMISFLMLTVLSPIYLLIGILVFFDLGWPVIYKQRYPGLNQKLFTLYRFKTMNESRDKQGNLLSPEQRLTKLGRFFKSYHLQHLPEFYNVLIGDMSLVGPRPVLIRSIPSRNRRYMKCHSIRPGMTGWSQIHSQQNLTWEEKFILDVYYIEHQSIWFDIKIICKSLILLLIRQ